MKKLIQITAAAVLGLTIQSCNTGEASGKSGAMVSNAAEKVYVAPGEHDEFYGFFSGGFSGQLSVYGLPSGRLFKVIPVFSQDAEKGYGYNEETKAMLNTSYGFVPWGDLHHLDISQTNGELDGRWVFTHENNTPRVARIDLTTFETAEILEIPNSAGNHSFAITENTEYLVAGTRFAIPSPQKDMTIADMKGNFKGPLTFINVDQETGGMEIAFQVVMPGFNFDLAHPGRAASHGWMFATTYNSEEANSLLEVNASQNDKDYIVALNWQKIEEFVKNGGGETMPAEYAHNVFDHHTHTATSEMKQGILTVDPTDIPGAIYFLPTPKSPHGCDVDPSGEYIVGSGKLATQVTVFSYSKMMKAIEEENFVGDVYGMPVLDYDSILGGIVENPGLGPLHTEFDGKGNAYTTFFISSEVVKWRLEDYEILDRKPTFYSVGHLMVPGGNSQKPFGKYMVAMNKITKDRYLPTGPEMNHSAQLYDITGDKMEMILDFPTIGEPHYAAAIPAEMIKGNSKKIFRLDENKHKYAVRSEADTRVERDGDEVHVYMSMVRSHFAPDNIEGIKVGDKVYFHVTNLEQDFDIPHGFAMIGANTAELLIMPGGTKTLLWEPKREGVWPLYCTDFCSALHQEMQGYVRVSPKTSDVQLAWSLDGE